MPNLNSGALRAIVTAWTETDLDPADLDPVPDLVARAEALNRTGHQRSGNRGRADIARALAAGDITADDAIAADAAILVTTAAAKTGTDICRMAAGHLSGTAAAWLSREAPHLIAGRVTPAAVAIVDEAATLALSVDGIDTADAAARAPKATRDAWTKLAGLTDRFGQLRKLSKLLDRHDLIDAATLPLLGLPVAPPDDAPSDVRHLIGLAANYNAAIGATADGGDAA